MLLQPVGSAFEREDPTAEWKPAEGFAAGGGDEVGWQGIGGAWSLQISGIFERYEDEEGDYFRYRRSDGAHCHLGLLGQDNLPRCLRCTRIYPEP
ncbi:MAG: hypothetical protein IPP17_25550 [Bacteroidetes bacterium]|nr:hypothetical protein [Bacteroidota bacterium]